MRKFMLSSVIMAAMSFFIQDANCWTSPFKKKSQEQKAVVTVQRDQDIISAKIKNFEDLSAKQQKIYKSILKYLASVNVNLGREQSNFTNKNETTKLRRQTDEISKSIRELNSLALNHSDMYKLLQEFGQFLKSIANDKAEGNAEAREKADLAKDLLKVLAVVDQYVKDAQRPALTYDSTETVSTPGVKVEVVEEKSAHKHHHKHHHGHHSKNVTDESTSERDEAVVPPPPALSPDEAYEKSFGGKAATKDADSNASGLVVPPPPPAPPAPPPPPPAPTLRLLNGKTKVDTSAASQPAAQTQSSKGFTAADLQNVKLKKVSAPASEAQPIQQTARGFTAADLQNVKLRKVGASTPNAQPAPRTSGGFTVADLQNAKKNLKRTDANANDTSASKSNTSDWLTSAINDRGYRMSGQDEEDRRAQKAEAAAQKRIAELKAKSSLTPMEMMELSQLENPRVDDDDEDEAKEDDDEEW